LVASVIEVPQPIERSAGRSSSKTQFKQDPGPERTAARIAAKRPQTHCNPAAVGDLSTVTPEFPRTIFRKRGTGFPQKMRPTKKQMRGTHAFSPVIFTPDLGDLHDMSDHAVTTARFSSLLAGE
jgi:hypothetical protein